MKAVIRKSRKPDPSGLDWCVRSPWTGTWLCTYSQEACLESLLDTHAIFGPWEEGR